MALSTAVFVGEAQSWLPDLVHKTKGLKVNAGWAIVLPIFRYNFFILLFSGHEANTDVGPLISPQAKERCERLIESGKKEGAKVRQKFK